MTAKAVSTKPITNLFFIKLKIYTVPRVKDFRYFCLKIISYFIKKSKQLSVYKTIGLMSGSSLDGLDVAYCQFEVKGEEVTWQLFEAETIKFDDKWVARLAHLPVQNAKTLAKTHAYFGRYMAEVVNDFIQKKKIAPDLIASHGHTIFHEPERYMTLQIGDGAALAALTGITTVCDFRTQDIALSGEGTPIAPAADRYLFAGYDFYLNIGGIANVTCNVNGKYIAFDICPANQVLNMLANVLNLPFDLNGEIARSGHLNEDIDKALNSLDFYEKDYPKSLDNNWIRDNVFPFFNDKNIAIADQLQTATRFIAKQISKSLFHIIKKEKITNERHKMLVTGGGGFNAYLIKCIQEECTHLNVEIELPDKAIVEYKEAILMGLMGVLRMEGMPNCFSSVTGAKMDTIGGAVYLGKKKV